MKARVKATGRVIEVMNVMDEEGVGIWEDMSDVSICPTKYHNYELEFIELPKALQNNDLDYWERLKHQYAGMAMQGILSNPEAFGKIVSYYEDDDMVNKVIASKSLALATALVEKLKEKGNGN